MLEPCRHAPPRSLRPPPHPRRRLRPRRHRRQHARDRHPSDAGPGRRPAPEPPAIILAVWIVGGLYTLLGAVCLAELGTMLSRGGRLLRVRATRVRRHGRIRGRLDRLDHLLRGPRLRVDRDRRVRRRCSAVARRRSSGSWRSPRSWVSSALQLAGRAGQQPLPGDRRRRVKFVAFLARLVAALLLRAPACGGVRRVGAARRSSD